MDQIDVVIVGAGVVGLAVAEALSRLHPELEVLLVEKHQKFGQETSDRNSEVIHGGMYYPTGSLKAKLCVEGNKMLYEFCEAHKVSYERIGKIIITRNAEEEEAVKAIYQQGLENGVEGLRYLSQAEVNELEPNIFATGALFSANTGIISAYELMHALERLITDAGVMVAYEHNVQKVEKTAKGYAVHYQNREGVDAVECKYLFNCAGLYSDDIPAQLGIDVDKEGYRIYPVKGEYFSVSSSKSKLINHLVYPPPLKGLKGLGTHVTKSLDGRVKLGPSAFYIDNKTDYKVDGTHKEEFLKAGSSYLPFLDEDDLDADMAGIRPKNQAPGAPWADFIIRNEWERGLPNLIDLVGIESPGLTSCLAIAEYAVKLMK